MIARDDAIEIARGATQGVLEVPEDSQVEVEETAGTYVVRFLAEIPLGVRGPDFHAQVTLDAETGEMLEILAGS